MKRWKWIAAAIWLIVGAASAMAAGPSRESWVAGTQIIDNTSYFDANSMLMFFNNTGSFGYDKTAMFGKNDGGYFPKGTNKSWIYAAGLWTGSKVNNEIRIALAEYSNEFVPGPMAGGTFQADKGGYRVYKIKKGDTRETNLDYRDWPYADGAPALLKQDGTDSLDAEGNRIPLLQGDQAMWAVFNDADPSAHSNRSGSTPPMGLEIQAYVFGYARSGPLGQTIFLRWRLINKGGNTLDSTFLSLWMDPDLGDAGDDLVGSDTVLSLGYIYNSGSDNIYGDAVPAGGMDFFQGPIVPSPGDSAWVSSKGVYIQGYKNLPMTSFNKYINGTDPTNSVQTYNYMRGLSNTGEPQKDPDGVVTKFVVAGDPVAGTGWLDDKPADRRIMMTTGPFTMAPGDTQEVVGAVLVGQGTDRLSSITELKRIDRIAQSTFDLNFRIPGPPPQPTLYSIPHDGAVQLLWGTEADDNLQYGYGAVDPETGERPIIQSFVMEGFNVYQGASSSGPWTKLATYDVVDGVQRIYNYVDNPRGKELVVVQAGTDNGLTHELWIENDRINGGALINNRPYYFTVTSFNYDTMNVSEFTIGPNAFGIISETFENLAGTQVASIDPRSETGVLADTADHPEGISDGTVLIDYYDQNAVTGHKYHITFNPDLTWNLVDVDATRTLLVNQGSTIAATGTDGFIVRVLGPASGISKIVETANASGPVSPPDNVAYSLNSTRDWYISSDQANNWSRMNFRGLIGIDDWEIRFTAGGSEYYDFDTDEKWSGRAPFEIWNIGPGTPDDATDDRRVQFTIIDDDESGGWSVGDRIYVIERLYVEPLPDVAVYDFPADFHIGRIVVNDNSGNGPPVQGTVIRFVTNKPNAVEDVFEFVTHKPGTVEGTVIANSVDKVHPVPNPYYNLTPLELDQFRRIVRFVNLPAARTTVRIFNLAGDLVRTLVKTDPATGELDWDVLTETGLPVASGLYIYHVEADGIGTKVGKLAVFTEVEQLNTY